MSGYGVRLFRPTSYPRDVAAKTDLKAWALATSALLFLFIGFAKGTIDLPVDVTILACLVLCLALIPYFRTAASPTSPVTLALAALIMWLAFRLLPDFPAWGLRKLATVVLFGVPAFIAGIVIAKDERLRGATMRILAYAGLPASAAVIAVAAMGNPYAFAAIGSGGYQLTGIFLALSAVSAAVIRQPVLVGVAALGCAVTGHISSALFGLVATVLVFANNRDWHTAGGAAIATGCTITLYTLLVAPPLVFMRLLWKFGGVLLVWMNQPVSPEEAASSLGTTHLGAGLNSLLEAMPEESQEYLVDVAAADRLGYFSAAWHSFMSAPLAGHGYGAVEYLGASYPHNAILEIAAETGCVGAALALATFGCATVAAARSRC